MFGPADNSIIDLLDHHPPPGSNPVLSTLGNEFVGQISEVLATSSDDVLVYVSIKSGGLGALLVGVGEDACNIEAGALLKVSQNCDVRIGLTREAGNEVRPQTGLRAAGANGIDDIQKRLGVTESTHATQ